MKPVIRISVDLELEKEIDLVQLASLVASRAHTIDGVANAWEVKLETNVERLTDQVEFYIGEFKNESEEKIRKMQDDFEDALQYWINQHRKTYEELQVARKGWWASLKERFGL